MERRIILFLVLSMAVIVLYPYLLEKMGFAKRPASPTPRAIAPKKDGAAPATVTAPAPPSAQILPTPAPSGRMPTPATEGREQEVTVETDLVKVVLSNRGGVIKRWELKRYLTSDPRDPKPIQLVPALAKDVSLTLPLTVQVPDAKLQERLTRGLYAVSGKDATLSAAQPAADVVLSYTDPETGVQVSKRLTFHHGSYLVDLTLETTGVSSSTTLSLGTNFGIHEWQEGFVGFIDPATFINGKLAKDTPEKEDLRAGQVTWVALQDKYFLAALIPADPGTRIAVVRKEGEKLVSVGLRIPATAGALLSRCRLFVGPKEYDDDRERLNKELMKFYKERKVNPVGGCLPMFFQIPVFVALFNILYMTIELRQAPFLLWVKDLSVQDPYYVLPILMGVTMFIQQKIQPTTMDPKQAQIMLLLPVFLTFLFISFPAGLVLYWLTNNVLTIAQQVITDRYLLPRTSVLAPK